MIRTAARRNRRSQTAEVEARLQESFIREGAIKGEGPITPSAADKADVRELIVMMEMVSGQLDLIRREVDARMEALKPDANEQN